VLPTCGPPTRGTVVVPYAIAGDQETQVRLGLYDVRFHNGLIAEDWVITDLAERLLLAKKR